MQANNPPLFLGGGLCKEKSLNGNVKKRSFVWKGEDGMERLLTIKDVCKLLQVSQSLVYKWIHFGFIPHIKLGALVRFRESDLVKWVAARSKCGRKSIKREIELER
jgi:excisionase family DNA binding protein